MLRVERKNLNQPLLWIIIIAAVLLRILAAAYMGDRVENLPGIYDQITYDSLAQRVVAGHGFSFGQEWWPATPGNAPTAHWSFVYTLYLATVYFVAGHHPVIVRLIQAILVGILLPWLSYRLASRIHQPTTGLIAAGISAIYVYFVYYGAALMTEAFYMVSILAALDLALDLAEQPRWRNWLLLGLVLGVAILLRQVFLLFVPVLFLWLLWAGQGRVRIKHFVIPLATIMLLILPWTIRNYAAFDRFVLLNTNAGFAFFWANHPVHGTNFVPVFYEPGKYQALIPMELRTLNEAELDAALLRRGLGFVVEDPLRYISLSLTRIGPFFKFWPSSDSSTLSNVSRVSSFALCLPFMIYGFVLSLRQWRSWSLLYLLVGTYTMIHVLVWTYVRYRLPIDPIFVIFAAFGLNDLYQRSSKWLLHRRLVMRPSHKITQ